MSGIMGVSLGPCMLLVALGLPSALAHIHRTEDDLLQERDYANIVVVRPDVQVNASGEGIIMVTCSQSMPCNVALRKY
jgi:hypothetical protein